MIAMRCPWYIAGPVLGLLIIGLRAAVNKPLGALGGYIDLVDRMAGRRRLGFGAFLIIGAVIGSAVYTLVSGASTGTAWSYAGAAIPTSSLLEQSALLGVAGLAMGFGARTAGGCTSGHGLSGNAHGSPASMVATMTFFATAVGLAFVFAWLTGGSL